MPGISVKLGVTMTREKFAELHQNYDFVAVAVGTHIPRRLQFPGHQRVLAALEFLKKAKSGAPPQVGKEVVVIGAGNVGCDVACEAYRLGAERVTLVDIQKPLAFGKEKEAAEALGATFRWPVNTKEVTEAGLMTTDGELIPAQTVIISIGDVPALSFLPESVETLKVGGADWVCTDQAHLTSDAKVLAVGDVERPGLATHALGAGKTAAEYIIARCQGKEWHPFSKPLIPQKSLTITHYLPMAKELSETNQAGRCLSCASCRDCHLCETICPTAAISRREFDDAGVQRFEYRSDDSKCIGCGFCADTCPCGIWQINPF
jgi:NADPH-dependent glutamate synthase beta subunit-like oxidoreductase/Pyruvate/2-oxoacid:ferredoxin oxidoreductase delta subunit